MESEKYFRVRHKKYLPRQMLGVMEEAPVSPGSSGDAASPSKVFRSAVGSPAAGSRGSLVPSVEYVDAYSEILR